MTTHDDSFSYKGEQISGNGDTESNKHKRCIREAIKIRMRRGDEGQYHLSHVFDDLVSPKEKSLGDKRTGNSKTTKAVVVRRH